MAKSGKEARLEEQAVDECSPGYASTAPYSVRIRPAATMCVIYMGSTYMWNLQMSTKECCKFVENIEKITEMQL